MGLQRGSTPAGVSGVINAPGVTATGIEYRGECLAWSFSDAGNLKARHGRGDGTPYANFRWLGREGGGVVKGSIASNAWPASDNMAGAAATLVRTFAEGKYITTPIQVTSFEQVFNEKSSNIADFTLKYVTTGPPVYTGWTGTQPTGSLPTKTDQQQWLGTIFSKDPNALLDGAQVTVDWWSDAVLNSNVGEIQRLSVAIANYVAPFLGMKLRTASITRNAVDGGSITYVCGLTDSKDDTLFPHEIDITHPDGLGNYSTRAALNNRPSAPGTANTFFAGTQTLRLTDGQVKFVDTYDRWGGEKNQREMTGTYVERDPTGLGDKGAIVYVVLTANGLPADPTTLTGLPSGLQVVNRTLRAIDKVTSEAIFSLSVDNAEQTIEQDASDRFDDPNVIDSTRATANFDSVASVETGFRDLGYETKAVRHNRSLYIRRMGKLDSLDRLKVPRYKNLVDRDGTGTTSLGDVAIRTKEWLSNTVAPTAPDDVPTNNVKVLGIDDVLVYAAIDTSPALYLRVFVYGPKSSRDDLVIPATETTTDASEIQSTAIRAYLDGETVPTTPDGMVLRFTKPKTLTEGLLVNRVLTVLVYGLLTVQQEIEYEHTFAESNPLEVFKRDTASIVTSAVTPAALADALLAANLNDPDFESARVRKLTPTKSLQIIKTSGEDKKLHSMSGHTVLDSLRGLPASMVSETAVLSDMPIAAYSDTAAKVDVKVLGRSAGGLGFLEIVPTFVYRSRGRFAYRRTFITNDPPTKYFLSLQGRVNNDTFLGFAAHTVMYSHPQVLYCFDIGPAHQITIDYVFSTDNCFFINDGDLLVGRCDNFSGSPLTLSGYYAATLFGAQNLLRWPTQAAFGVFAAG